MSKWILYSTNLFKRNDIIVYCNFLKTDRIFSWNTSKFSSCPVDAENGFKLDNLINMKEDMYIFVSRVRIKIPQFLLLKIDCQYWKLPKKALNWFFFFIFSINCQLFMFNYVLGRFFISYGWVKQFFKKIHIPNLWKIKLKGKKLGEYKAFFTH